MNINVKIGTNNTIISINKEDYEKVLSSGYYLCNTDRGYIILKKYLGTIDGKRKYEEVYLHRFIMNAPKNYYVDHIDRNKLNNTRENLRICTPQESIRNIGPKKGKYKGVHFNKLRNKYVAQITLNRKVRHLGYFSCDRQAAIAYNKAALELHGEFAFINEVEQY